MTAKYTQKLGVELEEDEFDTYQDLETGKVISVRRFTWRNTAGVSVQVITYGATITSIKMPDKNGTIDDIVMGFDDMQGNYLLYFIKFGDTYNKRLMQVTRTL